MDVDAGPLTGTWSGTIDAYMFTSGSNAIVMNLALDGTTVTGTVTFGNEPAPPPATDGSIGYPPMFYSTTYLLPDEGFSYSIVNGTFDGSRLQFGFNVSELWNSWCSLQTSYAAGDDTYRCLPNTGSSTSANSTSCSYDDPTTGGPIPINCDKLALCEANVCTCTASGCTYRVDDRTLPDFDIVVAGSSADGSSAFFGGRDVHFTRK